MDDERARLVSALRQRLTEHNAHVVALRRQLADDFRCYAAGLVTGQPPDLVADVSRAINAEARRDDLAALFPGFEPDTAGEPGTSVDVLAPPSDHATSLSASTLASSPTALQLSPALRSLSILSPMRSPTRPASSPPRERRPDFTGLFTPPFLPLLDSSSYDRHHHPMSPPSIATAAAAVIANGMPKSAAYATSIASSSEGATSSPAASDTSKIKSALRRSSSFGSTSSHASAGLPAPPRRVRFSFDGEEVLPTSTPPDDEIDMGSFQESEFPETFPDDSAASPSAEPEPVSSPPLPSLPRDDALASPIEEQRRWDASLGSGSLDPGFQGVENSPQHHRRRHSNILDDDFETVPLTRRLSSSDRLRALSKVPLEDPSMWTVVDPQADPSAVQLDANSFVSQRYPGHDVTPEFVPFPHSIVDRVEEEEEEEEEEEDDSQSSLSMRSSQGEAERSPPRVNGTAVETTKETDAHLPPGDAGDDEFFEFDDEELLGYPLSRVSTVRPYLSDNEEEEDDDEGEREDRREATTEEEALAVDILDEKEELRPTGEVVAAAAAAAAATAAAGTTGAVVDRGSLLQASAQRSRRGLSASLGQQPAAAPVQRLSSAGAFAHSVGSYRGQPLSMFNVVKDPQILQEVAQLGEFSSFVGGVDGRTGADDDDSGAAEGPRDFLGSYPGRGLRGGLSGTPRSLSERMALEEAMR